MAMPRTSQAHGQPTRSLGFFLQCNGESESTWVLNFLLFENMNFSFYSTWSCNASAELRLISQKEGVENITRSKIGLNHYGK